MMSPAKEKLVGMLIMSPFLIMAALIFVMTIGIAVNSTDVKARCFYTGKSEPGEQLASSFREYQWQCPDGEIHWLTGRPKGWGGVQKEQFERTLKP